MKTLYKFWFHPKIASKIAQRYAHISLNELLALQQPSPELYEIWESTLLDGLFVSAAHVGAEPNQPTGCNFEVHVVHVLSNAPYDNVIEIFRANSGFFVNSVEVPE